MLTYVLTPRRERLPLSKPSFTHLYLERVESDDGEPATVRPAYCTIFAGQPQCDHGFVFEETEKRL